MAQRSVPAPFLTKTYELVDDASTNDVISWNATGTAFVVWKHADFARDLLPKYFKHNNFSSFVRQLNTYGFRKIVPDKWEFANENFRRNEKHLLAEIHRRKTAPPQPQLAGKRHSSSSNSGEDPGSSSTSSNPGSIETATFTQLANLSCENENLKKQNEILSAELQRAQKQCNELIGFLTGRLHVAQAEIEQIVRSGESRDNEINSSDDDDENGRSLKLFGVELKVKKRRLDAIECIGSMV